MDPRGRGTRGRSYGGRGSGGRHLVRWDAGGSGIGCPHDGPGRGPAANGVRGWAGAPPQGDRPGREAFGGRGDQRGGWPPSLAPGPMRTGRIAVQGRADGESGRRGRGGGVSGWVLGGWLPSLAPGPMRTGRIAVQGRADRGSGRGGRGGGASGWVLGGERRSWRVPVVASPNASGVARPDSMASHLGRMESMGNMITYHYEESHVTTGAYRKKGTFTLKMSVINMNFLFLLVAVIFLGFLYTGSFPKLRMGVEVAMYDA